MKEMVTCNMCERRVFLKAMAATAAFAATVPSFAEDLLKDKQGKIRVGLVFIGQGDTTTKPDWPHIGYDYRPFKKKIADALNVQLPDVEFVPMDCTDGKSAKRLAADKGLAGFFVLQLNVTCHGLPQIIAARPDAPILYAAVPYGGNGAFDYDVALMLRRGVKTFAHLASFRFEDMVGFAGAFNTLVAGGTAEACAKAANDYRIAHTPPPSGRKPKSDDFKPVSAEAALASLRGKKILAFERAFRDQDAATTRDFGIIVERHTFAELNGYWEKADLAAARKYVESWKATARAIVDVSDEELLSVAKMSVGMRQMMADFKADAITIDCLAGCYGNRLKAYPCLGFMELLDDGLVGACECDIPATVSVMVASALAGGRSAYISDPTIDSSTRTISLAHCVAPRRFLGRDTPLLPYEILTHNEDRRGASVRTIAPEGYRVTSIKIMPKRKFITLQTGIVVKNEIIDRGCRTKIITEIDGDFEKVYRQWDYTWWHRITVYGDISAEVRALAAKLGYTIAEEC